MAGGPYNNFITYFFPEYCNFVCLFSSPKTLPNPSNNKWGFGGFNFFYQKLPATEMKQWKISLNLPQILYFPTKFHDLYIKWKVFPLPIQKGANQYYSLVGIGAMTL